MHCSTKGNCKLKYLKTYESKKHFPVIHHFGFHSFFIPWCTYNIHVITSTPILTSQIDSARGAVKGTQAYDIYIFCCFSNQASIRPWASFEKDFDNNFFHTLTEHTGKYLFDESYEKKIWKRVHSGPIRRYCAWFCHFKGFRRCYIILITFRLFWINFNARSVNAKLILRQNESTRN